MGKNEKSGFLLYKEQFDGISQLSLIERGELLTAIYQYQIHGNISVNLSVSASMAFMFIKGQFERDKQKYSETCEKRKRAVETRYQPSPTNEYNCSNSTQMNTKATDTDTDTDTVTDTDTELPKGNKEESIKEEKRKRFLPPTLDEVREYCYERQNNVNASQFIDFYTANGWKVGKNSMKDWKAAVRTWERNGIKSTAGRERTEAEKAKDDEFIRRQFERFEEIGRGL